jgi:hypothetical protein
MVRLLGTAKEKTEASKLYKSFVLVIFINSFKRNCVRPKRVTKTKAQVNCLSCGGKGKVYLMSGQAQEEEVQDEFGGGFSADEEELPLQDY